jgi:hypothetical protein
MCKHKSVQFQLHFNFQRSKLCVAKPLRLGRLCRSRRKIYVVTGANGRDVSVVFNPTPFWLVNQLRRRSHRPVFLDYGSNTPLERYAAEGLLMLRVNREAALERATPEQVAFCRAFLS